MTKLRPPVSFADAVTRVAVRLTWPGAAAACGKAERTVRNWSDPDTGAAPSIEDCLQLDAAFLRAGGGEPPLLAAYALQLEALTASGGARASVAEAAGEAMREAGEFGAHALMAVRPGATRSEVMAAIREGQDLQAAAARAVLALETIETGGLSPPAAGS